VLSQKYSNLHLERIAKVLTHIISIIKKKRKPILSHVGCQPVVASAIDCSIRVGVRLSDQLQVSVVGCINIEESENLKNVYNVIV